MKRIKNITCLFICSIFLLTVGCKDEEVDFSTNNCKVVPPFIKQLGFGNRALFSTSHRTRMGLLLEELRTSGEPPKIYQDSTWLMAGWLSPIQIDNVGNIFVAPAPNINTLYNPVNLQNTLYKVEGTTGKMNVFLQLPATDSVTPNNPFGIMGLAYMCESNTLYVSSIAGSTRAKETGTIFAIDPIDKKIIDKLEGFDAMGIGVSYKEGRRKLYFGSTRTPDIYSIELNKEGKFSGKPEKAFSLENFGDRGDDKARKIRPDNNGNLIVSGKEFNYNLIAPTEKQETVYEFIYSDETKQWSFSKILSENK